MSRGFVSLYTRAQRQLAAVGAGVGLLLAFFGWIAWDYTLEADAARQAEQLRQQYQAKLAEQRAYWQRAAQRLRTQIEFLRIGELDSAARRARLQAFFTAQGENRDFAGVLLLDTAGLPLFSLGCEALLLQGKDLLAFKPGERAYLRGHCADERAVYALVQTSLWLGREGKGTLVFAAVLDNALLAHLAQGDDALYLVKDGRVVAASSGLGGLNQKLRLEPGRKLIDGVLQLALPLDAEDKEAATPWLVIRRNNVPLLSHVELIIAVVLNALLLSGLIWLGLGRALQRHTARLALLSNEAEHFRAEFRRSAAWSERLARICTHADEIARLGETLDGLMDEAEARQREQRAYQQTLDMLDEVVVELDLEGRLRHVSSAWPRVTGISAEVRGRLLADFLDPQDAAVFLSLIDALRQHSKEHVSARVRLKNDVDVERWLEMRLTRSVSGRVLRGVLRDVTQNYLQERRITHMALHDALTGLPNRVLLEDRLKMALRLAERGGHKVALGFIDLDHFKHVNDNLGHKTGDELLVALAQRLRRSLRAGDTLARWGGDEFVVLLPELPDEQAAREVAAKLRAAAEAPLSVEDTEFNVTFSAGFALYPDDARESELLLAHADRAMFHAKAQGRNALQFYGDMGHKGLGRREVYIQQRLVAAIREGRIVNHYQPQVEARSRKVTGVEVLARWHDEALGWVSPATFIPMAEDLGLIGELGEQVWHQALVDAAGWRELGIRLAVNLSRRQLFRADFTRHLLADVMAAGLTPEAITLEITESVAIMDAENSAERLRELQEAGFRLSIDDFGTGYSSLSQLHELPVHELKIDLSFVRRIHTERGARMIQTIVGLAHSLGLATVAEGVEDDGVALRLTEMGVDLLQGWECGRPMPADKLLQWIGAGSAPTD
ncbi:MAG: EAL domain-containing protein [Thiobacillaceae bacterium]|nr:EAL domain-containing protein [Thiobacillaceae bacterium]